MSNEAKGPYTVTELMGAGGWRLEYPNGKGVVVQDHDLAFMLRDCANMVHSQALTSQAARVRELERLVLEAIDAEPELSGPMPDGMWNIINGDRTACTHALVVCVQETKAGIRERVLKALTPKEPQQ